MRYEFNRLKMKLNITNKQKKIAQFVLALSFLFLIISFLPFIAGNPLTGIWGIALIAIFLTITCLIVSLLFFSRAKKMIRLLNGTSLLSNWTMDNQMQKAYAQMMWKHSKEKNKALMWIISFFFVIITIPFLFILDDNHGIFLFIMGSVFTLILISSLFFPWYYRRKNLKGDKQILIGPKYIYINGYFHNWDFPLSGLKKIKPIQSPFNGIELVYYYTDRTFTHSHTLFIPTPPEFNRDELITKLKKAN